MKVENFSSFQKWYFFDKKKHLLFIEICYYAKYSHRRSPMDNGLYTLFYVSQLFMF